MTKALKQNLYYHASNKPEGRLIAKHGDTLASRFVADEFKTAGMAAPGKINYELLTKQTRLASLCLYNMANI